MASHSPHESGGKQPYDGRCATRTALSPPTPFPSHPDRSRLRCDLHHLLTWIDLNPQVRIYDAETARCHAALQKLWYFGEYRKDEWRTVGAFFVASATSSRRLGTCKLASLPVTVRCGACSVRLVPEVCGSPLHAFRHACADRLRPHDGAAKPATRRRLRTSVSRVGRGP